MCIFFFALTCLGSLSSASSFAVSNCAQAQTVNYYLQFQTVCVCVCVCVGGGVGRMTHRRVSGDRVTYSDTGTEETVNYYLHRKLLLTYHT
jgi:hypothetical protein